MHAFYNSWNEYKKGKKNTALDFQCNKNLFLQKNSVNKQAPANLIFALKGQSPRK